MTLSTVSVVQYREPYESVKNALFESGSMARLKPGSRVFLKPNIVFWTRHCDFPKWGVITTSRVVEDVVTLLKEFGINHITIGEGMVAKRGDRETPAHAFESLGYNTLADRYGVKLLNVFERPFQKVELGDGISLNFNADMLESDFLINLPVLKSHNQTMVSLGIKNLKGLIDMPSRKKCHSADPERDLHYHVAKLTLPLPPSITLIDGIYSLERGPGFDGRMRRSNLLISSADMLSADMVGAGALGYEPAAVPYINYAAAAAERSADLSDLEIKGEPAAANLLPHRYDFEYKSDEEGEMPLALAREGIKGLYYRKFDDTMCTYCSALNGLILTAIRQAWQGVPWPKVEVLTGKKMEPAAGMENTVLVGQCMINKNKEHPNIKKALAAGGCPPDPAEIVRALNEAGIAVNDQIFARADLLPGLFMERYRGNPEYDSAFFTVE